MNLISQITIEECTWTNLKDKHTIEDEHVKEKEAITNATMQKNHQDPFL